MSTDWKICVEEDDQLAFEAELTGPAVIGRRRDKGDPKPYGLNREGDCPRVIIADMQENTVSRQHLTVEPLADGRLRITNGGGPINLVDTGMLATHQAEEVLPPAVVQLGNRKLTFQAVEWLSLAEATQPPGRQMLAPDALATLSRAAQAGPAAEALMTWLKNALGVLQSAATSADFFDRAAQALVHMVGLDTGRVLLRQDGTWVGQAVHPVRPAGGREGPPPSQRMLDRVCRQKRTFYLAPPRGDAGSLLGFQAVVLAPILDREGEVIGVLYGDRREQPGPPTGSPITELQAMIVELLAGSVAAGLARLEQEQAALQARVRFEQFFTRELSQDLIENPGLLEGREAAVSVLFCDIRGFSRISERLGPVQTVRWINDVMSVLSDRVLEEGGVLVDYIGDELMAMWGAPKDMPDHAARACRAALAMYRDLGPLNESWQAVLGEPIKLGIGLNTGPAHVGNTGSRRKFKYGPLGDTVNLASRVQGATKYLKTNLLITEATQALLPADFATRRLAQIRVVNIARPVNLFELFPADQPQWAERKQRYEQALEAFERGEFRSAAQALAALIPEHRDDGPALVLLHRTVQALVEERADFDPVWQLPGK